MIKNMAFIFLLILFFIVFILACCKVSGDISKEEEKMRESGVESNEKISIISSEMADVDTGVGSGTAFIKHK